MDAKQKKNFKNKLWYGTKLSQYKLEKLLRCFANDLSAKEAAHKTGISLTSVKKYYAQFREALFYASTYYPHLFNSAGIFFGFGLPMKKESFISLVNKRRQGRSSGADRIGAELIIRTYADFNYTKPEIAFFTYLATNFSAKFHGVLIRENKKFPPWMELRPSNPIEEMSASEYSKSEYYEIPASDYFRDLWRATEEGTFKIPDYVWHLLFYDRKKKLSNDIIYRDLRWYLLKHPRNSGNSKPSPYWDDYPSIPKQDIDKAVMKLFDSLPLSVKK